MKRLRWASIVIMSAVLLCCSAANCAGRKSSLRGKITAYRPADRMLQVASFVENRELFLFQVEGKSETLVKLVYVHQGYSNIKEDVLSGAKGIAIIAHRNKSCDQTLDLFEKDAPVIPVENDARTVDERVIFTDVRPRSMSKSYLLKCYVLDHWEPMEVGK
jgi:hypothetical protein